MNHRRRSAATVLALGAVAVLAACGGGDENDPESTPDDSPQTSEEITFFGWDVVDTTTGLGAGYLAAKEVWEEESGHTVTFDGAPFDSFVATATTRSRSGELGDVVEILPDLNHAAIFPALMPTAQDDYPDVADDLAGWNAGIIEPDDPNTFAGVPIGAQGTLFYYNKAIFEEAGLDPEAPPETWEDFEAALAAIDAVGKTPLGMSGADSTLLWWAWGTITPQFFTTPEDLLDVRTGEVPLTDQRFHDSLRPLVSTFEKGYWNEDYASKTFTDIEADFAAGNVGVVPGLITSAMNWKVWDEKLGKDAYGVFSAPMVEGGEERGQFFNPVLLYGLSKDTEKVDASRSWINFLASQEGQEIMLREAGQFPNRDDVDIAAVTDSPGAAAIRDLVEEADGGSAAAQNYFNTEAAFSAVQNITSAVTSGDIESFLADLQRLQSS